MKIIKVPLRERSYTITIGKNALSKLSRGLKIFFPSHRVVFITNSTILQLYKSKLNQLLEKQFESHWISIPDGERYKNLGTVQKIYNKLAHYQVDRKTGLVAIGGGVVGDIAGFVAATYLRGLSYIQVPTTLLSQVDSSVGGKTGVDLPVGKNLVGAFYQPAWVLIDTHFLKTLPHREFLCGISEVVKYGILWDAHFFDYIEKNTDNILKREQQVLETLIAKSCQIKAKIVSLDEKENGLRSLLNYGHTLGHAIEALEGFKKNLHGEAVSRGMVFAAQLSYKKGYCSVNDVNRIKNLLRTLGLPTTWPKYSTNAYKKTIALDKKSGRGKIQFVAIKKIGKAFCVPLTPLKITEFLSCPRS